MSAIPSRIAVRRVGESELKRESQLQQHPVVRESSLTLPRGPDTVIERLVKRDDSAASSDCTKFSLSPRAKEAAYLVKTRTPPSRGGSAEPS